MANATDAREAFIQEVFGEIVKVEKSVKETAAQVRNMVVELRQSEAAISLKTSQLLEAANQLAKSNEIVSLDSKKELKWAIRNIEAGTIELGNAMKPLTDLTLGLKEVGRVEAEKQIYSMLARKEKKIDSMLAVMDVFLQQIELASERLPQLQYSPQNVSQINEGNIKYLKNGWDIRTWKRDLQNMLAKRLKR